MLSSVVVASQSDKRGLHYWLCCLRLVTYPPGASSPSSRDMQMTIVSVSEDCVPDDFEQLGSF